MNLNTFVNHLTALTFFILSTATALAVGQHPGIYVTGGDLGQVKSRIAQEKRAEQSWQGLLQQIEPYVARLQQDP